MHSRRVSKVLVVALWLLGGCDQFLSSTPEEPEPAPAPDTPEVVVDEMQAQAENVAMVPSPVETQKALEAAGIDTKLATLIPKRAMDLGAGAQDQAAIRTGVVLADMLLTVKSSDEGTLVSQIHALQSGMNHLEAGPDFDRTLADMKERVESTAVTRDELLAELEEMSGAVIPELEFRGQERVVPLIQAGSWLEGANLVAKALQKADNRTDGEKLLKAPTVVDYFLGYVKTEGTEKAPEAVTQKLEASLTTLKGIAEKPEALSDEDLATVVRVTDEVLSML
ncbi:MAG: hypothetical protein KTR31_35915 [Myxococcales bacterium]|nr:hypothetical protein [Myxococcales bacterium]